MKNDKLLPIHPVLAYFAASLIFILCVTFLDFLVCALDFLIPPRIGLEFSPDALITTSLIMLAINSVVWIIWLGLLFLKWLASKLKISVWQSEKCPNQLRVNQ